MAWRNNDGLTVGFASDTKNLARAGSDADLNGTRTIDVSLIFGTTEFPGTVGTTTLDVLKTCGIPTGSFITAASLEVETAFASGGSATLTLGTAEEDGTAVDADGIDATIAVASLTQGAIIACDGAQVKGAPLSKNCYLTVTTATAAFTAGKARLRISYKLPTAV